MYDFQTNSSFKNYLYPLWFETALKPYDLKGPQRYALSQRPSRGTPYRHRLDGP